MIEKVSQARKQVKPGVLHRKEIRKLARAHELFLKAQPDYKENGKQLKVAETRRQRRKHMKGFLKAFSYGMNQGCANQKKMPLGAYKTIVEKYLNNVLELRKSKQHPPPKEPINKVLRWREVLNKK